MLQVCECVGRLLTEYAVQRRNSRGGCPAVALPYNAGHEVVTIC